MHASLCKRLHSAVQVSTCRPFALPFIGHFLPSASRCLSSASHCLPSASAYHWPLPFIGLCLLLFRHRPMLARSPLQTFRQLQIGAKEELKSDLRDEVESSVEVRFSLLMWHPTSTYCAWVFCVSFV